MPVIYGHYWRTDKPKHGTDWTARTACVDFSAVKHGNLVAYMWSAEPELSVNNYTWVGK